MGFSVHCQVLQHGEPLETAQTVGHDSHLVEFRLRVALEAKE